MFKQTNPKVSILVAIYNIEKYVGNDLTLRNL